MAIKDTYWGKLNYDLITRNKPKEIAEIIDRKMNWKKVKALY